VPFGGTGNEAFGRFGASSPTSPSARSTGIIFLDRAAVHDAYAWGLL
jgi:hypothetical protein